MGTIVVERKYFNLTQPGIEPRSLDLQVNTLTRRCKSRLLPQGSRSVLYIPRPCETSQNKSDIIAMFRPPNKSVYWKTIFFISHPKHVVGTQKSLMMPISDLLDRFFYPILTLIIDSYKTLIHPLLSTGST